jgi:hypothetical protein
MRQAANRHWRAAAWLLERTNAQRFAKQNIRLLKPEQVQEFTTMMGQIIADEMTDQETYRRVMRRFDKLIKDSNAEVLATQLDPFPKSRKKKKPQPISPPTPAWLNQSPDEFHAQQSK